MNLPKNDHVSEASTPYGKAPLMSEEEIKMTVRNSQAIEGYTAGDEALNKRMKALMKKHDIKVSF